MEAERSQTRWRGSRAAGAAPYPGTEAVCPTSPDIFSLPQVNIKSSVVGSSSFLVQMNN